MLFADASQQAPAMVVVVIGLYLGDSSQQPGSCPYPVRTQGTCLDAASWCLFRVHKISIKQLYRPIPIGRRSSRPTGWRFRIVGRVDAHLKLNCTRTPHVPVEETLCVRGSNHQGTPQGIQYPLAEGILVFISPNKICPAGFDDSIEEESQ